MSLPESLFYLQKGLKEHASTRGSRLDDKRVSIPQRNPADLCSRPALLQLSENLANDFFQKLSRISRIRSTGRRGFVKPQEGPVVGAWQAKIPDRLTVGIDDGEIVHLGSVWVVLKVFGKDAQGAFSIVEYPLKPRTLVPTKSGVRTRNSIF